MTIDMKKLKWQKITCLEEQICLSVPQEWKRPSEEMIAKKFPYSLKPQEIFANLEGSRIITLNLIEKQLQEEQVYSAIQGIQKMISHIHPESIQESVKGFKGAAGIMGWFSFVTGGIKSNNYHYMFIMPVCERLMLGSYHFSAEQVGEDRSLFMKIIKSIELPRDIREEKQGNNEE